VYLPAEQLEYYSSILDDKWRRVGGQEHSGEFLDKYIFTDDPKFNLHWECVGFKIQFVHLVHMPDLLEYLVHRQDIKIIVNTRRHLLEHTCAELWCQRGNSRGGRPGEEYAFAHTEPIVADPLDIRGTFVNLCRYRQFAIDVFDDGDRDFLEWSYEDMFGADGSLDIRNHELLFKFLEIEPTQPFVARFAKTPRPSVREYLANYDAVERFMRATDDGVFAKYFDTDYDPRADRSWPTLTNYQLGEVMYTRDNLAYRA
jgi:hypothetical protein